MGVQVRVSAGCVLLSWGRFTAKNGIPVSEFYSKCTNELHVEIRYTSGKMGNSECL